MGDNYIYRKLGPFEFGVVLMHNWRLWFWWRDWDMFHLPRWKRTWFGVYRIRPSEIVKQRMWKLQIGKLMFTYHRNQ